MRNSLSRLLILFDVFDELQLIYQISKFGAPFNFSAPLDIFKKLRASIVLYFKQIITAMLRFKAVQYVMCLLSLEMFCEYETNEIHLKEIP